MIMNDKFRIKEKRDSDGRITFHLENFRSNSGWFGRWLAVWYDLDYGYYVFENNNGQTHKTKEEALKMKDDVIAKRKIYDATPKFNPYSKTINIE